MQRPLTYIETLLPTHQRLRFTVKSADYKPITQRWKQQVTKTKQNKEETAGRPVIIAAG